MFRLFRCPNGSRSAKASPPTEWLDNGGAGRKSQWLGTVLTVSKKQVELGEVFDKFLKFTPTPTMVEEFKADIRKLHPTVLYDALREAEEGTALKGLAQKAYRQAIHGIYTRKLKELASLYPFLFAAESALRARVAEQMELLTGKKAWWVPILGELRGGRNAERLPRLYALSTTGRFLSRIVSIIYGIEGEHLDRNKLVDIADGLTFLGGSTFGQLRYLILDGWANFEGIFKPPVEAGLKKLTKLELDNSLKIIMDARNELYHHNPIKERQKVVTACEKVLDYLDLHLGSLDQDLQVLTYTRPTFAVTRSDRHRACRP